MLDCMNSRLSVLATPIGNLGDVSERALATLRACDVVLCEDTRVTARLLARFAITKPTVSYHAHSGDAKYEKIFSLLDEGKHLVLVSDAGTPAISDPGALLVGAVRTRYGDAVRIDAVPGPSAVAAALSISGIPADRYVFLGFPPHKKGRKTFFDELALSRDTTVFFESPHRILKALEALAERLQNTQRVAVSRELTKVHEETIIGSAHDVFARFSAMRDKVRGEFVVVVEGIGGV